MAANNRPSTVLRTAAQVHGSDVRTVIRGTGLVTLSPVTMGEGFVDTPQAVALIEELVQSSMPDLQRLRRGVWALPVTNEITALLTVDHWKGASFSLGYGVCCAWVPFAHRGGPRLEWPRTMRQSVKHLWVDHFTADTPRPHYISHLHGRDQLRRDAHEAVAEAERKARLWWKSVATPEGVVVEARRQAMNEYDIHWPKARLVAAFTLARLGDLSAARQELQVILDSMRDGNPEEADRLAILLEETSPHPMQ